MGTTSMIVPAEVGRKLGVSRNHVIALIANGDLEAINISQSNRLAHWRIPKEALDRFIAARTNIGGKN